jgi:hypothetical protein
MGEHHDAAGSGRRLVGGVADRTLLQAEKEPAGREALRECATIFSSRFELDGSHKLKDTFAWRLFYCCDFICRRLRIEEEREWLR